MVHLFLFSIISLSLSPLSLSPLSLSLSLSLSLLSLSLSLSQVQPRYPVGRPRIRTCRGPADVSLVMAAPGFSATSCCSAILTQSQPTTVWPCSARYGISTALPHRGKKMRFGKCGAIPSSKSCVPNAASAGCKDCRWKFVCVRGRACERHSLAAKLSASESAWSAGPAHVR